MGSRSSQAYVCSALSIRMIGEVSSRFLSVEFPPRKFVSSSTKKVSRCVAAIIVPSHSCARLEPRAPRAPAWHLTASMPMWTLCSRGLTNWHITSSKVSLENAGHPLESGKRCDRHRQVRNPLFLFRSKVRLDVCDRPIQRDKLRVVEFGDIDTEAMVD